jgi:ketosteroid isomerase-like protein
MKVLKNLIVLAVIAAGCLTGNSVVEAKNDRAALEKTSEAIRSAFARGDIPTILAYHHPDVIKALSYKTYLNGRNAVEADLRGTFQQFNLEFIENRVENLLIEHKTAIEQSVFTIKGTPKNGGEPFVFRGRAMVVYVRYKKSPTGWASIREVIQAAVE